ncbi:GGDEF domain-containing protein [Pleionea sediminis]|uniref:GGDEF domain-containing protein n=1 Tax=Pleionea sediminis TaxID=2569479 RepID=UPI0011860383|nr:GGDEF domain-containing protein [Pleionea sediminis]
MEILLWRWSTIVQICSDVMIAMFFLHLSYSIKRAELKAWLTAWLWNLVAIAITVLFWLIQPESIFLFKLSVFIYIFAKTLFICFLVYGLKNFIKQPYRILNRKLPFIIAVSLALIGTLIIPSIPWLGVFQSTTIAIILLTGTFIITRSRSIVLSWLAFGFIARVILALIEMMSYWMTGMKVNIGQSETIQFFLASHSSFDAAAEWWIALGCVIALYQTIQKELTNTCESLIKAKDELKELADRDPLTGLGNRRNLRTTLDHVKNTGGTILFFDLDNFKKINDQYGHQTGDDCLKYFANALTTSFRPSDHLFRFAGDEFIVVAENAMPENMLDHIESVKTTIQQKKSKIPMFNFSVGTAFLEPGGEPDEAIRRADKNMYEMKNDS